jgi:hypothetical protein
VSTRRNQAAGQRNTDKVRDQIPACVHVPSDVCLRRGQEEIDNFARAARAFPLLPGSDGWQTGSITVDVPPGASVLIVSLWTATMDGKIENRTPHYVDDVRLSGIFQEQTP